jgi:hypothetical protein
MARVDIFDYIEVCYSRTRHHSHLGGVSPEGFEKASPRGQKLSTGTGALHHAKFQAQKNHLSVASCSRCTNGAKAGLAHKRQNTDIIIVYK